MVEKRQLPQRERRESAAKRMASSPVLPPPKPTPPKATPNKPTPSRSIKRKIASTPPRRPSTPLVIEEGLPGRVKDNKPLPTVRERQSATLSSKEYQSMAESGVFAAAVHRSKSKWIADGVFERYWTKPSKKKGTTDVQNPGKDTMKKLGQCTIIIEPHVFEATLHTIQDPQAPPPPKQYMPPPMQQQQWMPPGGNVYQYYPPYPPQGPPHQHRPPAPQYQMMKQEAQGSPALSSAPQPPMNVSPRNALKSGPPPNNPPPAKPSPDPVIQMLATRAASDTELKSLMKIVASSKASQEELRKFQAEIDKLNAIIASKDKRQDIKPQHPPAASPTPSTAPATPLANGSQPLGQDPSPSPVLSHYVPQHGPSPVPQAVTAAPPRSSHSPYTTYPPPQDPSKRPHPQAHHSPYAYPLQPMHTPPPKPEIKGIVFEFNTPPATGATPNTDRYLFPTHSIIDYLLGEMAVIVSFLVVRKGAQASDPSHYKENQEYFQPVTMKIIANSPKILEPLGRVVKPAAEVRTWMEETMKRCKRAEEMFLAGRLPREKDDGMVEEMTLANTTGKGAAKGKEDVDGWVVVDDLVVLSEDDELLDVYGPPSSVVPFRGGR